VLNEFVSFVKIGILIFLFLAPIAIYLSATSSSGVSGFVWNYNADWFAILVGYLLSEIGFLFIAIFLITKFSAKLPEELSYLFYVSIIIFCLLCLTKYGVWNDLMARGNIPLMFIFSIYICSQIVHTKTFPKSSSIGYIYVSDYSIT
jgi:small-conductance mechanosensitive channel